MKKLVLLAFLIPIIVKGQKLPNSAFYKVRIIDSDKTIQADILPVTSLPYFKSTLQYYWYAANIIHVTQGGLSGKPLNGLYTEFYLNKGLKEQGAFNKGLKTGVWKSWSESGNLVSSYTWANGIRSGPFSLYDNRGKPLQTGNYSADMLNGVVRSYHGPDSVIIANYRNGKIFTDTPRSLIKRINIFKRRPRRSDPKANKDTVTTP